MTVQSRTKPVEQVVAAIQSLDLEPIKFKLMDPDEGQGWSREYVERMAVAYKRFLTLLVTHPEATVAPTKDIDKFWHGHILDTMKYAEDCERVFGYFLHHFPYFGMRGEEDAAALADAGQEMHRLYREEFGEEMPRSEASPSYCFAAQVAAPAYCFASKPSYCFAANKVNEPAYCFATTKANDAAYCFASKKANEAAYCFATKPSYCFAAKKADAAYCFASKKANEAAYCFATKPSYCFAAKKADAAYCFASKPAKQPDVHTRPSLAHAQ
jgi:Glycine-rich domain-containing protein-like